LLYLHFEGGEEPGYPSAEKEKKGKTHEERVSDESQEKNRANRNMKTSIKNNRGINTSKLKKRQVAYKPTSKTKASEGVKEIRCSMFRERGKNNGRKIVFGPWGKIACSGINGRSGKNGNGSKKKGEKVC